MTKVLATIDVTDLTVQAILERLSESGVSANDATVEYKGCGTHEVVLVLLDRNAPDPQTAFVPKKLPPSDAYLHENDGITDPLMLDLPEEPVR